MTPGDETLADFADPGPDPAGRQRRMSEFGDLCRRVDADQTEAARIDAIAADLESEFDLTTRAGKVAWCKHRAALTEWPLALNSMIQDMALMGIPLAFEQMAEGMGMAGVGGETGMRAFIDSIG